MTFLRWSLQQIMYIYIQRALKPELADQVAVQLIADDLLEAHAQNEICIHENTRANPLQIAGSSALAFSAWALFSIISILVSPEQYRSIRVMTMDIVGGLH